MALGGRDIDGARADHFVDFRDAFCAVSQRRNCLRAADGEHSVNARNAGGSQYQLIDFTTRSRHYHHDFGHACDLGRNGVHQHRRWVRGFATGYVQASTVQGRDFLAQHRAVGFGVAPGILLLFFVIAAYTMRGFFKRFTLRRGDTGQRQFQTLAWQDQVSH